MNNNYGSREFFEDSEEFESSATQQSSASCHDRPREARACDPLLRYKARKTKTFCFLPFIFVFMICLIIIVPFVCFAFRKKIPVTPATENCDNCRVTVVEAIPVNMTFSRASPKHVPLHECWSQLITLAQISIDISARYMNLTGAMHNYPIGEKIFDDLITAATERGVKIRAVMNTNESAANHREYEILIKKANATLRFLNMTKLIGKGIHHTKMIVVDQKHFFIGSPNTDWRALTENKELGVAVYNCSCLAKDIDKIFEEYWLSAGANSTLPQRWPLDLRTTINGNNPLSVNLSDSNVQIYVTSSPPVFCPKFRSNDLQAVLDVINRANKFIYISVSLYLPQSIYLKVNSYWPVIDDALRQAAMIRGIQIRLLVFYCNSTQSLMMPYLRSLKALNEDNVDIDARMFSMTSCNGCEGNLCHRRKKNEKFVVTDNSVLVGSSDWTKDYFTDMTGVSVVFRDFINNGTTLRNPTREQILEIFYRDWTSEYSHPLSNPFCLTRQSDIHVA